MISSPNRSQRGSRPVSLVVVHTAEGARTVTALGNYFAQASVQASSHVGIDDTGAIEQYVPYSESAWTIRSANPISDNAELCGFAAWTREQWLNEHQTLLAATARWIRERCLARGIPIVKLTPAQVAAGQAGVIGHVDWTVGMADGTHTDPGPGFPWDVVMQLANPTAVAVSEDPMTVFTWPAGAGAYKLVCPVGTASAVTANAWLSLACDGVISHFDVWFQGDKGGLTDQHGSLAKDQRAVWQLPDGCTQVTVHYVSTGPVGACLEAKPK